MTVHEQRTTAGKEEFYHSSFNDEESLDFHQALDVVGYRQEVALIRVKINYILKNSPSNITLLLRAIKSLETLVRLQQRDKHDSLARIQNLMDTQFNGLITPGKPVAGSLHELMADSTRTNSRKTAFFSGVIPAASSPPHSTAAPPPPTPAENKLDVQVYPVTPESGNPPSLYTERGLEGEVDVSMAESASIRNRQRSELAPGTPESVSKGLNRGGEVTTPLVSPERPVPQFHYSTSLFRRKKSRKKR